jgi:hypothetical protein
MLQTLYDKLWQSHVVHQEDDGTALIYIDRHLVHEVTSPQAFEGLKLAGRKPWRVSSIVATADHNTPTDHWDKAEGTAAIDDPIARLQVDTLDANIRETGSLAYFPFKDLRQGIVHVVGPENGATLPGMTVVCGDSHTSTHGAFACMAHGIGTSEVEHVMATQCLVQKKSKAMLIRVDGALGKGVTAKDVALAIIGKIGTAGGNGYAIEFAGSAIRGLSMEGRMTLCNMAIEGGARMGFVAVDETTIEYLKGRCLLAHAEVRRWRAVRPRRRAAWRPDPAAGQLGHFAGDGGVDCRQRAGSGQGNRPGQARGHGTRAAVHGTEPEHADQVDCHRQGVHRFVHQLAHRGSARRRCRAQGSACGSDCKTGAGRAGLWPGQAAGREGRSGQDFRRRRFRVARAWLFDVPGDERRPAGAGRALRLDLEPQLRRPSGSGWAYPSGQPADGRRGRHCRPFRRCS